MFIETSVHWFHNLDITSCNVINCKTATSFLTSLQFSHRFLIYVLHTASVVDSRYIAHVWSILEQCS